MKELADDRKRTRFLLDADVEAEAGAVLKGRGYDVMVVARQGMDDVDVWEGAKKTGRLLVTHDADFWRDSFRLDRSPGVAVVSSTTAAAVVSAVSFLRLYPDSWRRAKLRFIGDDRINMKVRSFTTGGIERKTFLYRRGSWEEQPSAPEDDGDTGAC